MSRRTGLRITLHREAVFILDKFANKDFGKPYDSLSSEEQAAMRQRLENLMPN